MNTDSTFLSRRSFLGGAALAGAGLAAFGLAGCSGTAQDGQSAENGKGAAAKPVILVVSFGTSYPSTRYITIGAIECAIRERYPEYDVRRAFTAQTIIDILKERDSIVVDNIEEALERCVSDGVTELIVQPTHLMAGLEYTDLANALASYQDKFETVSLGAPLLTSEQDYSEAATAIADDMARFDDGQTAIVLMGHGTEAASNQDYTTMQQTFDAQGLTQYFVGTVEASPTCEDVIAAAQAAGYSKAVLRPFMVVAGDHANNDMANADDAESWAAKFTAAGFQTQSVIEGIGQIAAVDEIYVRHVQEAIDSPSLDVPESAQPTTTDPLSASQIAEGTYDIAVDSDSSMFNIDAASLTVADGAMTCVITLGGTGYGKLFMGTADEAANASDSNFIPFVEDADGRYTYEVPVEQLNVETPCAAWSTKKEQWYDRTLTFTANGIPADSIQA